jgi:2-oxoglutarate ferredoxin oxidoreductase subunit delta
MSEMTVRPEVCKSCQYCISVCPKSAISLSDKSNAAGYQYAQVDKEKCIKCGMCYLICPDCVFEIA